MIDDLTFSWSAYVVYVIVIDDCEDRHKIVEK